LKFIEAVEIEWFRGIREGLIEGFSDFTVLVGRNGAGKSTVLEALYLTSAWLKETDEVRNTSKYDYVVYRRGGRGRWRSASYALWYSMDTSREVRIAIKFRGLWRELLIYHNTSPPTWLVMHECIKQRITQGFGPAYTHYELLGFRGGTTYLARKALKGGVATFTHEEVLKYFTECYPVFTEVLRSTLLIDEALLRDLGVVEKYSWPKVLSKRLDKEVVRVIKEEFEVDAEGLTYAPVGEDTVLLLQLSNTAVRIDDLGDGARHAVLTMLLLLATKPKLILIEEPESKLHPRGMRVLTEAILKYAKEYGAQVVVSTHSMEFIKVGSELAKRLGIEMSLIHLERSKDGALITRRLNQPDLKLLTDLGIDPRFLDML